MDITLHMTFLPDDDPGASLAFCRDTAGFEVPNDARDDDPDHPRPRWRAFEGLEASGAAILQEPARQPQGVRDRAVRDPAGNPIRIQEHRRWARGRWGRRGWARHRGAGREQP